MKILLISFVLFIGLVSAQAQSFGPRFGGGRPIIAQPTVRSVNVVRVDGYSNSIRRDVRDAVIIGAAVGVIVESVFGRNDYPARSYVVYENPRIVTSPRAYDYSQPVYLSNCRSEVVQAPVAYQIVRERSDRSDRRLVSREYSRFGR